MLDKFLSRLVHDKRIEQWSGVEKKSMQKDLIKHTESLEDLSGECEPMQGEEEPPQEESEEQA